MSLGDLARQHWQEWVATGVVGSVAASAATLLLGVTTGMYVDVLAFATGHAPEVVVWSMTWFLIGGLVGSWWRGRRALRFEAEVRAKLDEFMKSVPTRAEMEEAISTAQLEVARHYEGQGVISDTDIRLSIKKGSIVGFEREVLEKAIELGPVARRWLRAACDEGYVDVPNGLVAFHDAQGYFRMLVDEEENAPFGSTRYALRKGVQSVLRDRPEIFDAARDADEVERLRLDHAKRRDEESIRHLKVSPDR